MKLPQLSPILCGWFFTSCPPNRQDTIQRQIVKKQGWGASWDRRGDRLVGRFVNQDRDHSLHNKQDSRGSETLLGQFVSYPDEISQKSEYVVRKNVEVDKEIRRIKQAFKESLFEVNQSWNLRNSS